MLSSLLHYPDEELFNRLDEIAAIVDHSCPADVKSAVRSFLEALNTHSPIHIQERYTAAFDIDPATTLNITYHTHGDNEKRAAALAQLQHHYEQAGWERITGELPDYLPMMLEFLSVCPHPEHTEPVWQCLQGMQPLVSGLERKAPVYAALLQPIVRMAAERGASFDRGDRPPHENS
ncbi:MAG: nitrate reductase molybdenum cofactor assembly chaperone [Desulfosarcina sp.]